MSDANTSIVGLDIGSASLYACKLEAMPPDLQAFTRKYKPTIVKPDKEGIDTIAAMGEIFVLEPTGSYHRVWSENLQRRGKLVLFAPGVRTRNFARMYGILDKSDRTDAAVIAAYGIFHLSQGHDRAFVTPPAGNLREGYLVLRGLPKTRGTLINRVRGRLSYELPERAKFKMGGRGWTDPTPGTLWRELAGEPVRGAAQRAATNAATIGRGISPLSRRLASMICELERLEAAVEQELQQELDTEALKRYAPVFEAWDLPARTQVVILAAAHPLEQFLSPDGSRIIERVFSEKTRRGTSKRDRSLKAFKRSLACGKIRVQSGDSFKLVSTGDKSIRASIYAYLETAIVIRRQPTPAQLLLRYGKPEEWDQWSKQKRDAWLSERSYRAVLEPLTRNLKPWADLTVIEAAMAYTETNRNLARLQLFYEFSPICANLPKHRRIADKIFPRFVQWLFADLVNLIKQG